MSVMSAQFKTTAVADLAQRRIGGDPVKHAVKAFLQLAHVLYPVVAVVKDSDQVVFGRAVALALGQVAAHACQALHQFFAQQCMGVLRTGIGRLFGINYLLD